MRFICSIPLLFIGALAIHGAVLPSRVNSGYFSAYNNHPRPRLGYENARIVGGADAQPHSAPWTLSMQWEFFGMGSHLCGASLIRPNFALTAAHCLDAVPNFGTWLLIAGRHNIGIDEPATQQVREVNRVNTWRHERYHGGVGPFDIGLIRLELAFELNEFVALIALPTDGFIHEDEVVLHGWGSTSTSHFPINPDILQTVRKPIVPFAECERVLGQSPLHPTNVCTGPLDGGVSACSGDSGGPLTQSRRVAGEEVGDELVGIVSWGFIPCGSVNAPSVYTRVSAFIDWIEERLSE